MGVKSIGQGSQWAKDLGLVGLVFHSGKPASHSKFKAFNKQNRNIGEIKPESTQKN
jgi:hypothetical protein